MPAVFVSPRIRERQLREALQKALQQQDREALRQLSDRLVHRHGPVQLRRWMQALASEPQQRLWRQALAQPPKPVQQPAVVDELPPVVESPEPAEPAAVEETQPVEQAVQPAPAPIKTALQGWLPQWDGPQTDRLAS